MIRIVVMAADCGAAANVGGPVHTEYLTFDIEHPALEAALKPSPSRTYYQASICGGSVIPEVKS